MTNFIKFFYLILLCLLSSNIYAEQLGSKLAVGAKIGTMGVGVEGRAVLAQGIYGRAGANYFQFEHKFGAAPIAYKAKLSLFTVPLVLDYHPIDDSGFRLSAGIAYNGNKVTANATPTANATLYGATYSPAALGKIHATLKLGNKIGGIVAIGYDNSLISNEFWSLNAEAGIMYCGKPKLKISADGLLATDKTLIQNLKNDANNKLNRVKNYLKILPILSLGFKINL